MVVKSLMINDQTLTPIQIIIIMLVPAFLTGLPALISAAGAWKNKQKREVEAKLDEQTSSEKLSNAWEKLTGELQERVEKLNDRLDKVEEDRKNKEALWEKKQIETEKKISNQRKRITYLEDGVQVLIKQLESMGVKPAFILDQDEEKGE